MLRAPSIRGWSQRKGAAVVIEMKEFGRSLVTRAAGRIAYKEISARMAAAQEVVVFDFSEVETITNSFADEVFGHMVYDMGMDELRRRTTFRNISPFWARVIRTAMDSRDSQRAMAAVC